MADLTSPESFVDGQEDGVTAARLNNHVNGAQIQSAFISGKAAVTPATGDYAVIFDVSGAALAKCTLAALVAAVYASDPAAGVAGARTLSTTSTTAAAGNDTRFPASVTGIRKSAGVGSTDTAAVSSDYAQAASAIIESAGAGTGNAALNRKFTWAFPTSTTACTITINNIPDGVDLEIRTTQGSSSASSLTLVLNTGSGSGALTQKRLGGAGAVTNSSNAIDYILIKRYGTTALVEFKLAFS